MSSLIEFFDRTYVVNLPERHDRLMEMTREFKKVGVSFPSDQVVLFNAIKPLEKGEFPTAGVRGCFLSHLGVLKAARNQGLKNVLLIEDDLSFFSFFNRQQMELVEAFQQTEWDFAYLGHSRPASVDAPAVLQRTFDRVTTAHFVAFNSRVLDRLIDFLEEVLQRPEGHPLGGPMHVDGAYSVFQRQNPDTITLVSRPGFGFQRSSRSSLSDHNWFDQLPVIAQLAEVGRRAKTSYRRRYY